MTDLERTLTDLAGHLDVPDAEDWRDQLTPRLTLSRAGRHSRRLLLVAAAVAIVVASAGVVAVAPARHAVAGWLGIGAVEIRRTNGPIVSSTTTTTGTATTSTRPPVAPLDLAAARKQVQFEIMTPRDEPAPLKVAVDRRVTAGLVVLTYSHFTLVEIATDKTQPPPLGKLVGSADVEQVKVRGHDGMWIPVIHEIAFIDRSGQFKYDTVRRSGPVLLWERDGVTYRVEGPHTLPEAMTIAESIV